MTPSYSFRDSCDHRPGNPEPLRQILGKEAVGICSDQPNVVFRKFFGVMGFAFSSPAMPLSGNSQASRVSVLQVFASGDPLKVLNSIVKRIAIDVVDIKFWVWSQEGLRHKSMDKSGVPSAKEHRSVVPLRAGVAPFHELVAEDSPLAVNGIAAFKAWYVGPVRLEGVH